MGNRVDGPEKEKHFHGRYWCFVENLQECRGEDGETLLYFALPVDHPGQRAENIKIVPEPADIFEDKVNGNRFIIWKRTGAEKTGPMTFYYEFDLYLSEVNRVPDPDRAEPYDTDSPEYRRNIISEGWIDISEAIKKKALEITAGETNPCRRAKLIYDWLAANIKYEYVEPAARGATKTLERGKGDCGEFSALFVALCRSLSIPARTVTSNWLNSGGHQWAEFLLPPYGWVPADPTTAHYFRSGPDSSVSRLLRKLGGFSSSDPDWCFGNLYPDRIIAQIGENISITSAKAGVRDVFFYLLQPGGQEAIPSAAVFKGFSRPGIQCGIYVFGDKCEDAAYARSKLRQAFGEAFVQAKAYVKAEEELLPEVKERPEQGYPWLLLGQAQFAMKKYQAAMVSFGRAIGGQGGSLKPVWDALAYFNLGNCHDVLGERGRALAEYKKVAASGVSYEGLQKKNRRYMRTPYRAE